MTGRQAHKEWIGKTPNSRPPKTVRLRLFRKADGYCDNPARGY